MGRSSARKRAREMGIAPGILPTGRRNAITDVEPVRVGHVTVIAGDDIRTGATAVLPHGGNLHADRVPAGLAVGNGFGKLMGSTQIAELGEIETPVILTNTLCVPRAADAVIDWVLDQPGNGAVTTINPVVGETNDSRLNNIRRRTLTPATIRRAIDSADGGRVSEGSVGAGTGTIAFGWKGGIGTSSRVLPESLGHFTVGALVQSNFSGILTISGIPVGCTLGRFDLDPPPQEDGDEGSIMIILATDAPLGERNLTRLARRGLFGLARTGASFANGSGDYAIAFSTHPAVRRPRARANPPGIRELTNDAVSPLFQAAIEATEEAILNSLFTATTVKGYRGAVGEAIPLDRVAALLGRALPPDARQR